MANAGVFDEYMAGLYRDRAAAPDRAQCAYYWVDWGDGFEVCHYIDREWFPCGASSGTLDQASFKVVGPLLPPKIQVTEKTV